MTFDAVFATTYSCFFKPPYNTASEVSKVMAASIERGLQAKAIIRHNRRKKK